LLNLNIKNQTALTIVLIIVILMLGFIFDFGAVDSEGLRQGTTAFSGTKTIRSLSVILAALIAFAEFYRTRAVSCLFSGTNPLLLSFILLCFFSSVFSPVRTLTIFKSFEILLIFFMISSVHVRNDRYDVSKNIITALMLLYALTVLGIYFQFFVIGKNVERQLIGATPLFNFMLYSRYPAMAGNAVGYLGAIVALYGVYALSIKNKVTGKSYRAAAMIILVAGMGATFLSYTRSVLIFLLLTMFLYYLYRRKYVVNVMMVVALIVPLAIPQVRDKVVEHMRRGSSDKDLMSMSGRTDMWGSVFERSPILITIGQGYATGSKYMNFEKTGKLLVTQNVHNSFLEIVMSIGMIGGIIWVSIIVRLLVQYNSFFKKARRKLSVEDRNFHIFMMAVLYLSVARSIMNATFVYLDYFFFLFMALIMYGDSLSKKLYELNHSAIEKEEEYNENNFEKPRIMEKKRASVTLSSR